ncbi:hypothetical protein CsatA_018317 [Cannabis sativa]
MITELSTNTKTKTIILMTLMEEKQGRHQPNGNATDVIDMSSKLRGLVDGPLEEPSGRLRSKVAQITRAGDSTGSSLPLPPEPALTG